MTKKTAYNAYKRRTEHVKSRRRDTKEREKVKSLA